MFPRIIRYRQIFDVPAVPDIGLHVGQAMRQLQLADRLPAGSRVAITVGSRGITGIAEVIRNVVRFLTAECQALPFVFPAMGSHGGATAESQQALLAGLGIREETCGCPIRSSLETIILEETAEGIPVHVDRLAWEADFVLLVNRIKPHTDFQGPIQSGLVKMMLLGLGKYAGAQIYHRAFQDFGFDHMVQSIAPRLLATQKILGGVALVENANKQLSLIEGVRPEKILDREPELLRIAQARMARLPVQDADLLLIDYIGKNVSGTGMDTNVVGRKTGDHRAGDGEFPKIRRIGVRGLTADTHGNATGIGIAEFCLERVVQAIDRTATDINCLTSGHVTAGMTPLVFPTDVALLQAALSTIGLRSPSHARIVWIRNTAELSDLACSEAYLTELAELPHVEPIFPASELPFDRSGMLPDLAHWSSPSNS